MIQEGIIGVSQQTFVVPDDRLCLVVTQIRDVISCCSYTVLTDRGSGVGAAEEETF